MVTTCIHKLLKNINIVNNCLIDGCLMEGGRQGGFGGLMPAEATLSDDLRAVAALARRQERMQPKEMERIILKLCQGTLPLRAIAR